MRPPLDSIDVTRSDFRNSEIVKVPVLTIFGATPAGQKACMHVHGVFPYLYIPYDGPQPAEQYLQQLAISIDKAINVAFGKSTSVVQHVYKLCLVSGMPFYGYHTEERAFIKIYLYNPFSIRKLADLLLGGGIMNTVFQPHESHIPYPLQMFIDYNLYGMSMINVAAVKFRKKNDDKNINIQGPASARPSGGSLDDSYLPYSNIHDISSKHIDLDKLQEDLLLGDGVKRLSRCELEVDVVATDIINRLELQRNVGQNPGLIALWNDEKARRKDRCMSSQLSPPQSPGRGDMCMTELESKMQGNLRKYLQSIQFDSSADMQEDDVDMPIKLPLSNDVSIVNSQDDASSASTQVFDSPDVDCLPVVNERSILRTVASSQSFMSFSEDHPVATLDTQDSSLAEMLADMGEGDLSTNTANKSISHFKPSLFEQDSILSQTSFVIDPGLPEALQESDMGDDLETIEMSQCIDSNLDDDITGTSSPPNDSLLDYRETHRGAMFSVKDSTCDKHLSEIAKPQKKRRLSCDFLKDKHERSYQETLIQSNVPKNCLSKNILVPYFAPPSRKTISDTYDCNQLHTKAYYGNVDSIHDTASTAGIKRMKIDTSSVCNLPDVNGKLQGHGLIYWQNAMGYSDEKEPLGILDNQKMSMLAADGRKVILTPVLKPPERSVVDKFENKTTKKTNNPDTNIAHSHIQPGTTENDVSININEAEFSIEELPHISPVDNITKSTVPDHLDTIDVSQNTCSVNIIGTNNSINVPKQSQSFSCSNEIDFLKTLNASELQMVTPTGSKHVAQLHGATPKNTCGFLLDTPNVKATKVVVECQYLTTLSMELHIRCRKEYCPNPEIDQICGIFYALHSDKPADERVPENEKGLILVHLNQDEHFRRECSTMPDIKFVCVENEKALLDRFIEMILEWDPDIFVGYEIEHLSWGYMQQRLQNLGHDLVQLMSRMSDVKTTGPSAKDDFSNAGPELRIPGRVVLNLWRILRHHLTLNIYTFENVAFHVLHRRLPVYSAYQLSAWFDHKTRLYQWRTFEYYITKTAGNLDIIESLDLIGQTSEFARVFGIEFYDVLSRGSQYRVESMMLRTAKPMNYIPLSPSVQQRARMKAPECIPLTLEPESKFYTEPVVVLDFQSLYPSIMIAYNICYSTCIGKLENIVHAKGESYDFGCISHKVANDTLISHVSDDNITITPNGVIFVKDNVQKGVLTKMLDGILNTRFMVKKSIQMHKDDKKLQRMLTARQLGLKLIANVTFGYTSANFSGRMPCVEIGDTIVRKARETLERAIRLVESRPEWGARLVYGDTDSMFLEMKGKTKDEAFKVGQEIADAVTADNPKPVKLKFEKVYLPCVLQSKKRYVGFMYEKPDQKEPIFDAKGIETVRRDTCAIVSKMLERSVKILFTTKDVSQVHQYVKKQWTNILEGKSNLHNFVFAKEYRGIKGYRPTACVPALEIAKRRLLHDKYSEPCSGQRVPYVIVFGSPGQPLIQLVREPQQLLFDANLRLHTDYYIGRQIVPPLARVFNLLGVNVAKWYEQMPKIQRQNLAHYPIHQNTKGTISRYFDSLHCPVCEVLTNQGACGNCKGNPQTVAVVLESKIKQHQKTFQQLASVCQHCMGRRDAELTCISIDCPVLFRLVHAQCELRQLSSLQQAEEKLLTH